MVKDTVKETFSEIKKNLGKLVLFAVVVFVLNFLAEYAVHAIFYLLNIKTEGITVPTNLYSLLANRMYIPMGAGRFFIILIESIISAAVVFPLSLGAFSCIMDGDYKTKRLFSYYKRSELKFTYLTFLKFSFPCIVSMFMADNSLSIALFFIKSPFTATEFSKVLKIILLMVNIWFSWVLYIYMYRMLRHNNCESTDTYKACHIFCAGNLIELISLTVIMELLSAIVLGILELVLVKSTGGMIYFINILFYHIISPLFAAFINIIKYIAVIILFKKIDAKKEK